MRALRIVTVSVAAASVAALDRKVGTERFCDEQGRHHSVTYDTTLSVSSNDIYDLDTLENLQEVKCDIDGSRLKLTFTSIIYSTEYWTKFELGNAFFTGSKSCPLKDDLSKTLLLRRVNGASLYGTEVDVETSMAVYDEIYSEASINYTSTPNSQHCGASTDITKCIGVNTDSSCKAAAQAIPVYSKAPASLVCDSCFFGLEADYFFTVEIKGFKLQSLQAGFRNSLATASVDIDMTAEKAWSLSIDKSQLVFGGEENPVIHFKIGPVPFMLWFDVNMQLVGGFTLGVNGEAKVGAQMVYDIGDDYVSWDPTNQWTLQKSNITAKFSPAISGKAGFIGQAVVHLIPTIGMHVNNMFTYSMTVDPGLTMDITGDSAKLCESTKYDVAISHEAKLHLNLPWASLDTDRHWGPATLFSQSGSLPQVCTPLRAEDHLVV